MEWVEICFHFFFFSFWWIGRGCLQMQRNDYYGGPTCGRWNNSQKVTYQKWKTNSIILQRNSLLTSSKNSSPGQILAFPILWMKVLFTHKNNRVILNEMNISRFNERATVLRIYKHRNLNHDLPSKIYKHKNMTERTVTNK